MGAPYFLQKPPRKISPEASCPPAPLPYLLAPVPRRQLRPSLATGSARPASPAPPLPLLSPAPPSLAGRLLRIGRGDRRGRIPKIVTLSPPPLHRLALAPGGVLRAQVLQGLSQGALGRHPARQHPVSPSSSPQSQSPSFPQFSTVTSCAVVVVLTPRQTSSCRASDCSRDYDGACLQMRVSYSPAASFLLFLVQWTDCSLAGALGLLRILIYKVLSFVVSACVVSFQNSSVPKPPLLID